LRGIRDELFKFANRFSVVAAQLIAIPDNQAVALKLDNIGADLARDITQQGKRINASHDSATKLHDFHQ